MRCKLLGFLIFISSPFAGAESINAKCGRYSVEITLGDVFLNGEKMHNLIEEVTPHAVIYSFDKYEKSGSGFTLYSLDVFNKGGSTLSYQKQNSQGHPVQGVKVFKCQESNSLFEKKTMV